MKVQFSSNMPSCICHMERNICDNFTLRFRDKKSDGAYSDLDLETNGNDPDYKPLPSEEMHSFGQDIDISDIVWLSSPELNVPFYRWRIVVSHLSESPGVPLSHMLRVPVTFKWANTKDQRWTYKRANDALGIPSWAKMDFYLSQKQHNYLISTTGPLRPANAD